MNLSEFKIKLITAVVEIGFDVKALRDWKQTLIDDMTTTSKSIWSSDKVSEELTKKVDKVEGKGLSDTNYTQAEKDKLSTLEGSKFRGLFISYESLAIKFPEGEHSPWHEDEAGYYADVDKGVGEDVVRYIWDSDDYKWVQSTGLSTQMTGSQIKIEYESQPDTNAYTDGDRDKLVDIEVGAQVNTITGVKGSAESDFRTGDVIIEMRHLDAGLDDPLDKYITARDS